VSLEFIIDIILPAAL